MNKHIKETLEKHGPGIYRIYWKPDASDMGRQLDNPEFRPKVFSVALIAQGGRNRTWSSEYTVSWVYTRLEDAPIPNVSSSRWEDVLRIELITTQAIEESRNLNPLTANVFADWLQENGEETAALKLRIAFPVSNEVV